MVRTEGAELMTAKKSVRQAEARIAGLEADLRMWKRLLEVYRQDVREAEAALVKAKWKKA